VLWKQLFRFTTVHVKVISMNYKQLNFFGGWCLQCLIWYYICIKNIYFEFAIHPGACLRFQIALEIKFVPSLNDTKRFFFFFFYSNYASKHYSNTLLGAGGEIVKNDFPLGPVSRLRVSVSLTAVTALRVRTASRRHKIPVYLVFQNNTGQYILWCIVRGV
jgi:hypothetical protein